MLEGPAVAGGVQPGGKKLFLLSLVGPAFLLIAAASAVLAGSGLEVRFGSYVLGLLDRDLAGLAVVFATAGAACLVTTWIASSRWKSRQRPPPAWRFAATAAAIFIVLCMPLLAVWPAPLVRSSFSAVDPGALAVYRIDVRGLKHDPYPLGARRAPVLIESGAQRDQTITCDLARTVEFGPFGWARDLDVTGKGEDHRRTAQVLDPQGLCVKGVDRSPLTADPRTRELLAPFVFDGELSFTRDQIAAAEGSSVDPESLDEIGRYLLFKRSAGAAPRYAEADHVYAVYRCDAAYARFLVDLGAHIPEQLLARVRFIRAGNLGVVVDARSWQGRNDPLKIIEGAGWAPRLSLSEPASSPACASLFELYGGGEVSGAPLPNTEPQITLPAAKPSRRR